MKAISPTDVRTAAQGLKTYDFGRSTADLDILDAAVNAEHHDASLRGLLEEEIIRALGSDYSLAARRFACEKLWMLGSDAALNSLSSLMTHTDWKVAEAACYTMSRRPSPKADEVVRTALERAEGRSLIAVITLAGERRDPACAPRLIQLSANKDRKVADAAIDSLGKIGSPAAIMALQKAQSDGTVSASHALLQAAQELSMRGDAAGARKVCAYLENSSSPQHIRRGAANIAAAIKTSAVPLFNGRDLTDFIVDTPSIWRVWNGVIIGRSPGLRYNEFLRTKRNYENFIFSGKLRLIDGIGNSGFQFRSKPVPDSHEVSGYQADAGERYWGALYDESRRKKTLAGPDDKFLNALDPTDWHSYVVEARGNRIRITLDGVETVNYEERDPGIEPTGFIALQVHAAKQPVEVWFKDLRIQTL